MTSTQILPQSTPRCNTLPPLRDESTERRDLWAEGYRTRAFRPVFNGLPSFEDLERCTGIVRILKPAHVGGEPYTVNLKTGRCNCKGHFRYGTCCHSRQVRDLMTRTVADRSDCSNEMAIAQYVLGCELDRWCR